MSYFLSPNQSLHPSEVPGEIRAVVCGVARDFSVRVYRTSGVRTSGKPSIHRFDCARDYDFWMPDGSSRVPNDMWINIVKALKERLPNKWFDVVDEWKDPSVHSTGIHVHIEFDPA